MFYVWGIVRATVHSVELISKVMDLSLFLSLALCVSLVFKLHEKEMWFEWFSGGFKVSKETWFRPCSTHFEVHAPLNIATALWKFNKIEILFLISLLIFISLKISSRLSSVLVDIQRLWNITSLDLWRAHKKSKLFYMTGHSKPRPWILDSCWDDPRSLIHSDSFWQDPQSD